ncbi:hypothetical protein ACVIJ6_000603 [Bradyrhizobium sp. USDA 4369]
MSNADMRRGREKDLSARLNTASACATGALPIPMAMVALGLSDPVELADHQATTTSRVFVQYPDRFAIDLRPSGSGPQISSSDRESRQFGTRLTEANAPRIDPETGNSVRIRA